MTIAYDTTTTGTFTAATSKSISHTGTGASLCAVVALHLVNATSAYSVTYGGTAMTLVKDQASPNALLRVVLFVLANAATGAQTVAASWTGSADGVLAARTYSGVATSGTVRDSDGSNGTGSSVHLTETLTTVSGDMCVDAYSGAVAGESGTPDGSQSETYGTGAGNCRGDGSHLAASGATTAMGYTGGGTGQQVCHASLALTPQASVGGNVMWWF